MKYTTIFHMEEFKDPHIQHKIQIIKENHEKLQNEDWKELKVYVKKFIQEKNISYANFIGLVKNLNNDVWINSHEIYTLKSEDNYLNLNKPNTANKLFKLVSDFEYNYHNDEDYRDDFDTRLTNLPKESIYCNKLLEIEHIFKNFGFNKFQFVKYVTNTITINVVIDIFKFDTSVYEYGKSKHPTILEKNKIVLKQFVSDKFQEMEIFKDVDIDIIEDIKCFDHIIIPL